MGNGFESCSNLEPVQTNTYFGFTIIDIPLTSNTSDQSQMNTIIVRVDWHRLPDKNFLQYFNDFQEGLVV